MCDLCNSHDHETKDCGKGAVDPLVRPPMWHHLKVWPEYFDAMLRGDKDFEARKKDRDFRTCDYLVLREWDPTAEEFTGRVITRGIKYILDGGRFGVETGHCVMSTYLV